MHPAASLVPGNPAVIYIHGNASWQLEGLSVAFLVHDAGIGILTLDLAAPGGEIISLRSDERPNVPFGVLHCRGELC
jgi:hypothetical protein